MTPGRTLERPWGGRGRAAAAAALVVVAAVALAVRPSLFAASPASAALRTTALGALYVAIAVASLLPPVARDTAVLSAPTVALIGVAALAVAWWAAGPTAPLVLTAASIPLSTAAAVAEEALFRRLAYGHLRRLGAPAAIGAAAILFAVVHVPAYGVAALPVDLGAGLLFGWQRWASGSWTVPAATHVAANALAVLR